MEGFFSKLPPTVIGIEACGSAHHWGRTLTAMGHSVRLLPAAYVKPFVKRNKTDARDAEAICEAICEAMQHPSMRFVPIKSVEQRAARGLETARDMMTATRGLLGELGIVAAQGTRGFAVLCAKIESADAAIPPVLLPALRSLVEQWRAAGEAAEALEAQLVARAKADPTMRRLMRVPGIGPLSAHAIVAAAGDGGQFGSARDFAAWAGLTPREHQSANSRRAGHISRQGDQGLRRLLTLGASAVMRQVRAKPRRGTAWMRGILARRPVKVAMVAQAAKTARIAWAELAKGSAGAAGGRSAEGMLRSGEDHRAASATA